MRERERATITPDRPDLASPLPPSVKLADRARALDPLRRTKLQLQNDVMHAAWQAGLLTLPYLRRRVGRSAFS